jgi:2-dehydro-3-deoxyphosphooctonate aldolase (KDO 8-P synthase)
MTFRCGADPLTIGPYEILPGKTFFLIAGPCVIESETLTLEIASEVARVAKEENIPVIFKASYDKANRTSITSFRGPGQTDGLRILGKVKALTGLPVLSDIHGPEQALAAADVLDVIQIPAFLSRQTDLLVSASRTGKTINLKKGQFQSPDDMRHALKKISDTGNSKIMLTERGTSFGYNDLVVDMRSILRMQKLGRPVVFDATHSAQFPGAAQGASGGDRTLVPPLARAAVAAGADGVFLETHTDPDRALCDGPNSLNLADLQGLVRSLKQIFDLVPHLCSGSATTEPGALTQKAGLHELSSLDERLKKIRMIIFDVDGVLTDGGIIFGTGDIEIKYFNVRDGHGIKIAKRHGLDVALVTGRKSEVVERRARELGIETVFQGMKDKRPALEEIMTKFNLRSEEIAVVGDDVVDIPLMRRVGVKITVPEAPMDVVQETDYVTRNAGGKGAAREIIEKILKARGKWSEVMERYYA